jgi:8-oxo-dGTP diphosphatase
MKIVWVSALVLENEKGEILLTQRPMGKEMAGLWEFPGGKIEPGESPENALIREIKEELNITLSKDSLVPLTFISHAYATFQLVMLTFYCKQWQGEIQLMEQQGGFQWADLQTLDPATLPAADQPLIEFLRSLLS